MGLLLLLFSVAGAFAGAFMVGLSYFLEIRWLRRYVIGAAAIWCAVYLASLFAVSAMSEEKLLERGQPKAFCGAYLDCHIHAMVEKVEVNDADGQPTYVVTTRIFSDAKKAALAIGDLKASVVFEDGATIIPAIEAVRGSERLKPGECRTLEITFTVPPRASGAKLLITRGSELERAFESILIGDEDSLLHAKTLFGLDPKL